MQIKEKIVASSNLNLWTQQLSDKNAVAGDMCLLISGTGAPAMFWTDEFCQHLIKAGYSVIRFDHRDRGLSDPVNWDKAPYTIEDLAEDAINILDAYNVSKAHVVGHSMGGIVAQWLAINYPDRIHSYTSMAVATCGIVNDLPKELMDLMVEKKPTQNFEKDFGVFIKAWEILNGNYEVDKEIAEKYTKDLYDRSNYTVEVAWHHVWCQQGYTDLRNELKNVGVAGLFIHGEQDSIIPIEAAVMTKEAAPNSDIIIIPNMGHMFFNREPENKIADYLVRHFKGV